MKKTILSVFAIYMSIAAFACDVCGCVGMDLGFGYIPLQKRHIIGINYSYNHFETNHPAERGMESNLSQDHFHSAELWFRYYLKNKWFLSASIAYKNNKIQSEQFNYSIDGLGDAKAQLYYSVWQKGSSSSITQTNLLLGAGIKVPTGQSQMFDQNTFVQNIQLGSGSWDPIMGSNFSWRRNKIGLNHELNYALNTANAQNFKYGNALMSRLLFFYLHKSQKYSLIPQTGINYMYQNKDYIDAQRQIERLYSGKSQLNTQLGLDVYTRNLGLRLSSEMPILYSISDGYVHPKPGIKVQLLYFFNNSKKNTSSNE